MLRLGRSRFGVSHSFEASAGLGKSDFYCFGENTTVAVDKTVGREALVLQTIALIQPC